MAHSSESHGSYDLNYPDEAAKENPMNKEPVKAWAVIRTVATLTARVARLEAALKTAHGHIEHMSAFIAKQKLGYSFEALGEDIGDIRSELEKSHEFR